MSNVSDVNSVRAACEKLTTTKESWNEIKFIKNIETETIVDARFYSYRIFVHFGCLSYVKFAVSALKSS